MICANINPMNLVALWDALTMSFLFFSACPETRDMSASSVQILHKEHTHEEPRGSIGFISTVTCYINSI